MKKQFKPAAMVNWYEPKMLFSIGLKAIISGTFGNYADRRELEAALGNTDKEEEEWETLKKEYCTNNEIWIDVVSDTGDGFNSTFSIAKSVAAPTLEFEYKHANGNIEKVTTQRSKILIFGGDEVYPFPTLDAYTNRFKIPFASGCSDPDELNKQTDRPHLYAIPGNHDWYDGLGNFIKLFCQQRWIGIWSTQQHRSYFALPLPNNYWIWATDIQLNSDIDKPQLDYFEKVAKTRMQEGDKIIMVTAEPAWIYKQINKDDRSFDKLRYFVNNYIRNENGYTGKSFKLAATLTGDLHQYSRYCSKDCLQGHQYIGAGGGGAFLHLTHNLPQTLKAIHEGEIDKQEMFPNKEDSRKLLLGNFLFPFKNRFFTSLLFCIYLFYFWITHYVGVAGSIKNPFLVILTLALGFGFFAFTDTTGFFKGAKIIGGLHALSHVALIGFITYLANKIYNYQLYQHYGLLIRICIAAVCCLAGSVIGGFIMGTYLYLSNRLFNMHINEASSSLASADYKNFLRLHLHNNGITIYPVGIKKVPTNWQTNYNGKDETFSFTGDKIETFLIEKPIQILNDQL